MEKNANWHEAKHVVSDDAQQFHLFGIISAIMGNNFILRIPGGTFTSLNMLSEHNLHIYIYICLLVLY